MYMSHFLPALNVYRMGEACPKTANLKSRGQGSLTRRVGHSPAAAAAPAGLGAQALGSGKSASIFCSIINFICELGCFCVAV